MRREAERMCCDGRCARGSQHCPAVGQGRALHLAPGVVSGPHCKARSLRGRWHALVRRLQVWWALRGLA